MPPRALSHLPEAQSMERDREKKSPRVCRCTMLSIDIIGKFSFSFVKMTKSLNYLLCFLVILNINNYFVESRVEEKIRNDPDLSEFYSLLENNHIANASLSYRALTVFAPTNQAFQNFKRTPAKDSLVSYHMATLPLRLEQMYSGQEIATDYDGNPPLWLTRTHRNDLYVNNARILPKSNYEALNQNGKKQVLHIISEVLQPVLSNSAGVPLYNPDAYQFLNQSESISVGPHRMRSFRQRVMLNHKEQIYQDKGPFTFFIPVDEGFSPPPRPEKIDAKVIDGHVIPDHVLFTGPTAHGKEYKTLAFGDMIKVTISFTQESDGKNSKIYVKSNTVVGDENHPTGVVLAEIVLGNIPVKNGVVHLIHRPLMVVDTTVEQFLKEKVDGPLYRFHKIIIDAGGNFMERINRRGHGITLFAPSNAAWNESYLEEVLEDKARLREILDLHLVEAKLPTEVIIHNNANEIFQVATSGGWHNLYFNVVKGPYNNVTLTVEGGGVNATVIQPDIAAVNGVVHIIDRVLGVPFTTVRDKLAADPMLNDTFFLGERTGFNGQLKNLNHKYTYFVPRDLAWKKAKLTYPSAHKKLFMRQYDYHVRQILERHLVIHDRVYTMAELKQMHNNSFTLPTLRDSLRIKIKEIDLKEDEADYIHENYEDYDPNGINTASTLPAPRKGYAIDWRGETISVFRPDVYCTNGIIHVIDKVLLQDSDVRVNGAGRNVQALHCIGLVLLSMMFLN